MGALPLIAWLGIGALVLVVAIATLQYRAQRNTYRSLSSRQPERRPKAERPLGYEALDLDEVARTTRRNEALERGHTNWTRGRGSNLALASETDIEGLGDDETYAARYHAAFQIDKKDKAR
ncbi:MAG: hypothetical protein P1U53_15365 [Sulfitobacter sp.]|nr:hypothetical protein [Sulfitobacter sp.]